MYTFDSHQDIADAILYASHGDFWRKNGLHEGWNNLGLPVNNQSDFIRLKQGEIRAIFGVSCAFSTDKNGNIIPSPNHLHETLKQINLFHQLLAESKGKIQLIRNRSDLKNIINYTLSFLLAIEGADSIDSELVNLETFFNLAVRSIGLTWSFNNKLAGGCNEDGKLTNLGKKAIRKMNDLGIILDLSHLNDVSAYRAIEVSERPVIVSHAACRTVYDHPRNVPDKLIKLVAQTGGAVGICGVPKFIDKDPSIDDVASHFAHALKLVGVKHVIIGTDFGSMTAEKLIPQFEEVNDVPKLLAHLSKKLGLKKDELERIAHKNLEKILEKTLPKS